MQDNIASDATIVIPTHDDWEALGRLLPALDVALAAEPGIRVLVVDDGSFEPAPQAFSERYFHNLARVDILRLKRNLGHQRAIAVGICYLCDHINTRAIVIMDGDGEDDPADVPRLLAKLDASARPVCVFAERRRRSETAVFRVCYALYRFVHWVLTGIPVRIGNFSALDPIMARRLTTAADLWNHYAATVVKAGLPIEYVQTARRPRLAGRSRMNFSSLVAHGLSAISVFSDRVGARLLIASGLLMALVAVLAVAAIVVRVATPLAIPGWATNAVGLLLVLLSQLFLLSLIFAFMVLSGRQGSSFLPERDYVYFVDGVQTLWQKPTAMQEPSSTSSPPRVAGSPT